MQVTKRDLGAGYVTGSGAVLALSFAGLGAIAVGEAPAVALAASVGLGVALAMVATGRLLPSLGIEGDQIWTVARVTCLGFAVATLLSLAVSVLGVSVRPAIRVGTVAVGGAAALTVGLYREVRWTVRRLERGNRVLARVFEHNLRNDLTVVLGHLAEIDAEFDREHVRNAERSLEEIVTTTEKVDQLRAAMDVDRRRTRPVNLTPHLETVVASYASEQAVSIDAPDVVWVRADWFVETVLENVVENAVVHGNGAPTLSVTVEKRPGAVDVRVVDDCPSIPENERTVFDDVPETPLDHSTGLGLWVVRFAMDSYGGQVRHTEVESGGNAVVLRFCPATPIHSRSLRDRVCGLVGPGSPLWNRR